MIDIIADCIPILLTIITAWMTLNIIGMAWTVKQFRDDMRREDEEANRKGNR